MTPSSRPQRNVPGSLLGLSVFLGGIALLGLTFWRAYQMFSVPSDQALGLAEGQAFDVARAGGNAAGILVRIFLLMVMALVGSVIANRGITLFERSLVRTPKESV